MRRLLPLLLLGIAGLTACGVLDGGVEAGSESLAATPAGGTATGTPTEDTVALTIYFRAGEGPSAHLERVTRRVPVDADLPRRALELLISGPVASEGGLDPTLPATTHVRELEISGGTARVVLSPEAVRDASLVGDSPANEALALAAIANTLTEFGSVERVTLEVEGQGIGPGEFWGGWGLPPVLVRDEAVIGTSGEARGVPDLGRFSSASQWTGSEDAGAVALVNVRVRERSTYVRVTVELHDPEDPDASVKVPRARARNTSDGIVIDLTGVGGVAPELAEPRVLELSDPAFKEVHVEHGERHSVVRVMVDGARERPFWLHSVSGPTRIVLDVKK